MPSQATQQLQELYEDDLDLDPALIRRRTLIDFIEGEITNLANLRALVEMERIQEITQMTHAKISFVAEGKE